MISEMGQTRKSAVQGGWSALPLRTDINGAAVQVRDGPGSSPSPKKRPLQIDEHVQRVSTRESEEVGFG